MFRENDQIGPYILTHKLGRGAFGVVWLAEKRTAIAVTRVALKIIVKEDVDIETIKQEAAVWVEASGHPNVLPIIDADVYDEDVVIASEYAPDGTLQNWLNRNEGKAPSTESAVKMTIGILRGLEHLHSRMIIHRDLKPANILLQGETPRLADFGLARVLKTSLQSSSVSGTYAYMPPEAFDGKRSIQTDVWSSGVILYQLLTGRLPFPQKENSVLISAILTREPQAMPDSIPSRLRDIVSRALQKNPSRRFQTVTEMRVALHSILRFQEVKAEERQPVPEHESRDLTTINPYATKQMVGGQTAQLELKQSSDMLDGSGPFTSYPSDQNAVTQGIKPSGENSYSKKMLDESIRLLHEGVERQRQEEEKNKNREAELSEQQVEDDIGKTEANNFDTQVVWNTKPLATHSYHDQTTKRLVKPITPQSENTKFSLIQERFSKWLESANFKPFLVVFATSMLMLIVVSILGVVLYKILEGNTNTPTSNVRPNVSPLPAVTPTPEPAASPGPTDTSKTSPSPTPKPTPKKKSKTLDEILNDVKLKEKKLNDAINKNNTKP